VNQDYTSGAGGSEEDSEINISLCLGAMVRQKPDTLQLMASIFNQHKVSYDQLSDYAKDIISSKDLVLQIEDSYYDWETGAPMLLSYLVFKQPLSPDSVGPSLNYYFLNPDVVSLP